MVNAGHTPCGARLVPEDAYDWAMQDGVLTSPTCAVERAVACVKSKFDRELAGEKATMETKYSKRLENLEKKMEMTGIRDLERGSTVGDVKLAVNQIKAKLRGETVPTVLATLFMAACAFGGITVQKENINDLGDADVVTGVEYVFDGVTPGGATNIASAAVSNLVTKSFVEGLGIDAGHTDEEVKELAGGVVSNAVTKSYVEGLGIEADVPEYRVRTAVSNVVTKSFVDGLGLAATGLTNNAEYFDNIRTNADSRASEAFSNAVAAVTTASTAGLPHSISEGERTALVATRTGDVLSTLVSTGGLQKVVMVDGILRVPDLQSVWVGGELVGDRIIGGETLYSASLGGAEGGSSGEIVGTTSSGDTLSVRYDMTAVVPVSCCVRTNNTQWTVTCSDEPANYQMKRDYHGTILRPDDTNGDFVPRYLGVEYWRGVAQARKANLHYQDGQWVFRISNDGGGTPMTFYAEGNPDDERIFFQGVPPSFPLMLYDATLVRGPASRNEWIFLPNQHGLARKAIATEDYVDTVSPADIHDGDMRINADKSVDVMSQDATVFWSLDSWDGVDWSFVTNLPRTASSLVHPYGEWGQTNSSAFVGHSLTNLQNGLAIRYGYQMSDYPTWAIAWWFCPGGGDSTYCVSTSSWSVRELFFSYRGETYRLTRGCPWKKIDTLATVSLIDNGFSVKTNGVPVAIEAYFEDGQVKWRLK